MAAGVAGRRADSLDTGSGGCEDNRVARGNILAASAGRIGGSPQGNAEAEGGHAAAKKAVMTRGHQVAGWVIENKADKAWKELVLKSIQPVGEGLSFSDSTELMKLYAPHPKASAV